MKKLIVALTVALIIPAVAQAESNKWTRLDKSLYATYCVFEVADILQTREIMKDDNNFYEVNPVLAPLTRDQATAVMVASTLALYVVADQIGPKYRPWLLTAMSTIKIGVTAHNYNIGVRIKF